MGVIVSLIKEVAVLDVHSTAIVYTAGCALIVVGLTMAAWLCDVPVVARVLDWLVARVYG